MWTDAERHRHNQAFDALLEREKHLGLMIRRRVAQYGDSKIAVRHKPYSDWIAYTWKQFGNAIDASALGLLAWNTEEFENIGIFAANRAEWAIVDYATYMVRAVSVPVYATNTAKELTYIVNHAEIRILFVGDREQYEKALSLYGICPTLKKIVVFDRTVSIEPAEHVMRFDDFMAMGSITGRVAMLQERLSRVTSADVASILYTSGTTGVPKGVVLSHQNWLAMFFGTGYNSPVAESDVSLAVLPLSHVFERAWSYYVLYSSGQVDFCHDSKALPVFLLESRPHFMTSVPRIWEKVHSRLLEEISHASPQKQAIFRWAMDIGKTAGVLKKNQKPIPLLLAFKYKLADKLVLSKIRAIFGGRTKVYHCGGSALSADIAEFFFKAGVFILQGYGLTECFPICVSNPQQNRFGSCGPVVPLMEARISESGEIQAKGPSMMLRYYNDPELTADALTDDGYFKTGDIGRFDENGFIVITERIKDLMKTSGGRYVAPQQIETLLKEDFYIEQAAVFGDERSFVSALIVPAFDNLKMFAERKNIPYSTMEELVCHPEVLSFFRKRIDAHTLDLDRYEKVKRFALLATEFTQENAEITPTQKLKRKTIYEHYRDQIEALYTD
ncbi:MAG: AMP-dependent synthetase/ligase [Solirubrobacterales bacterium]